MFGVTCQFLNTMGKQKDSTQLTIVMEPPGLCLTAKTRQGLKLDMEYKKIIQKTEVELFLQKMCHVHLGSDLIYSTHPTKQLGVLTQIIFLRTELITTV